MEMVLSEEIIKGKRSEEMVGDLSLSPESTNRGHFDSMEPPSKLRRKRTKSRKLEEDEFTMLSPNRPNGVEDDEEDEDEAIVTDEDFDDGLDGDDLDGDPVPEHPAALDLESIEREHVVPRRSVKLLDGMEERERSKTREFLEMERARSVSAAVTVAVDISPKTEYGVDDAVSAPRVGEVDLLRMMKRMEAENAALRVERSEMECNHSTLRTKYEYLKYDEQLMQEQMKELHEGTLSLSLSLFHSICGLCHLLRRCLATK